MKIILYLILIIILLFIILKISKSRDFQFYGGIIKSIDTDKKVVALTFDDGPTKNTDEILDILEKLDIKVTFFVTGKELEKNLNEGKKIVEHGHELGNHSYSHKRMIFKSNKFIKSEIEKTDELIKKVGYKNKIEFRPPYFKKLIGLPRYLNKKGTKTILCDVEAETFVGYNAKSEKIVEYTINNTKEGSIILLHAMYDNRGEIKKSIEPIVLNLKSKGYKFLTISELLEEEEK